MAVMCVTREWVIETVRTTYDAHDGDGVPVVLLRGSGASRRIGSRQPSSCQRGDGG